MKVSAGNPFVAQYNPSAIRGGSVGCSHLNQYLAAGVWGAKTHNPSDKICETGTDVMSKAVMTMSQPQLNEAMTNGLKWTMVKWQVEAAYPCLPELFQRALNIEHHIGEGIPFRLSNIISRNHVGKLIN